MNSEVLIIGGGIIGLSIARSLKKRGIGKITVVERGKIGQESSSAAAGMLAPNAEAAAGNDFFRFCTESNLLYPKFAEDLFAETGIDIEYEKTGTLYLAFSENDSREISARFENLKQAGLSVEHLSAREIRKAEPFVSPDVREGLFFPHDRQADNRKIISALRKFSESNNIRILENTEVFSLIRENSRIKGAETANGKLLADTVILATGAWTSLIKIPDIVLPPIKPIRGQIINFQTLKRLFFHVIYSPRGYIVPRLDGRILAGATVEDAGFDKSVTDEGIDSVWQTAVEIAPSLEKISIEETRVGLRPYSPDGLPVLGSFPQVENLFFATAHFRNGILLAPLTGEIVADKIAANKSSEYLSIFSPQRFQTGATAAENRR